MHWEALGAVAELLGAVGVIASLFYVASQIRRNSMALEAATNQAVTDSTQQRLLAPAESAALAAALAKARSDYDGLTPAEQVQLAFFTRATFRGVQNAVFQRRQGLLSETAWRDYEAKCPGVGGQRCWAQLNSQSVGQRYGELSLRNRFDRLAHDRPFLAIFVGGSSAMAGLRFTSFFTQSDVILGVVATIGLGPVWCALIVYIRNA